jgi:hypothetical protein
MPQCKSFALVLGPAFLLMGFGLATSSAAATPAAAADHVAVFETQMNLRDLWVEHVFWIRSYVLATHAGDAPQSQVAEAEVLSNAKALAASIEPLYGQAAADELLKLLAGHWGAVRDYNTAVEAKSKAGQESAQANLTSNAHAIAKFLSGANPHLPEQAVFGLLSAHGAHHIAQINQISSEQFRDEAVTWHAMRKHMLIISDAICDALAKQFPDRFQKES